MPDRVAKSRSPYQAFGWFITAGYLLVIVWLIVCFGMEAPWTRSPNEFGDFLAGAAAPLAFLWLILGFLQQGQELRLQAEELGNSVRQAAQQTEALKKSEALSRRDVVLRYYRHQQEMISAVCAEIYTIIFKKHRDTRALFPSGGEFEEKSPYDRDILVSWERFSQGDANAFPTLILRLLPSLEGDWWSDPEIWQNRMSGKSLQFQIEVLDALVRSTETELSELGAHPSLGYVHSNGPAADLLVELKRGAVNFSNSIS